MIQGLHEPNAIVLAGARLGPPKRPDDDRNVWRRQDSVTPLPGGIDYPDEEEAPGEPAADDDAEDADRPDE